MPTSKPSNKGFTSSRRSAQQGFTSSRRSAQQGFTPSRRSAQQGFTLIEMLVVLTVLALVAMVAAQRIGRRPQSVIRNEAQARLAAAIQTARREAGRTGSVRIVQPAAVIDGASLTAALPSRAPARACFFSIRTARQTAGWCRSPASRSRPSTG